MTMNTTEIAEIVSGVMYFDDPAALDATRSLFTDYGMSSLDFVDFAFELRSAAGKDFTPDDLWPINALLADRTCFTAGSWTETGKTRLADVFGRDMTTDGEPTTATLYPLFSIEFVERRLHAI